MTNIVFFGSSNFSKTVLQTLNNDCKISLVVTKQPMPVGRKKILTKTPVAELAETLTIPYITPSSLKDPTVVTHIADTNPDLFVVVAYGKIIPQVLLDIPKFGPLNIHGSLLPKYRGASPIQAALYNGDKTTGITIMLMDAQMDHGPIIKEFSLPISGTMTFPELELALSELTVAHISKTIADVISGTISPHPQIETDASFTKIIKKEDGHIDWNHAATAIYNQWRAYIQWPGIWTRLETHIISIKECVVSKNAYSFAPGTIIIEDHKLFVQCGTGVLELITIQPEGKNHMKAIDFINGHRAINHSIFS